MLYYSFETDPEPKIIGVRDGLSQVRIQPEGFANALTYEELESFWEPSTYWQRLTHEPPRQFVIEFAKLRPKAKLTDFLEFSPFFMGCPFMLSSRAKQVFADYYIQPNYLFDVLIYDKTGLVSTDYSLFYFPMLGYEVIDFAKSRFYTGHLRAKSLSLANEKEFKDYCDTQHRIPSVESLVMSETFDTKLDFFQCRLGPIFMSERLKSAVIEAGLSNTVFLSSGPLAFAE